MQWDGRPICTRRREKERKGNNGTDVQQKGVTVKTPSVENGKIQTMDKQWFSGHQ